MQNLLTITPDEFEKECPKLSFTQLKGLIEGIRLYQSAQKHLPEEQLADLQRKETKIWKELQRRGILNKKTNAEFQAWASKFRTKRIF